MVESRPDLVEHVDLAGHCLNVFYYQNVAKLSRAGLATIFLSFEQAAIRQNNKAKMQK